MKPFFICIVFVVIQVYTGVLAADVAEHSLTCDWEDVVRGCQGFDLDRNGAELCCHVVTAAEERRCFCLNSYPVKNELVLFGGEFCELQISLPGSSRCSDSGFSLSRFPAPRNHSSHRTLRKLGMEESSSETHFSSKSFSDSEVESIPTKDTGNAEDSTTGSYQTIMAAGFFSSFLVSCAVICPCWSAKRKQDRTTILGQDFSINSISSIDNSKSLSKSYTSSVIGGRSVSLGPFNNSGAHFPLPHGGFTMAELQKVTGGFSPSRKIGQGGFGTVYRGRLRDGSDVAVKRAKKDAFDTRLSKEFENELAMLSQVDHLNLVKLLGYLEEENERIIVVEFVSNGNLREHLDGIYGSTLDMATRLDIAIDIAHALTYLHLYAERPIIHRDVKASNILLTDTCRAKVADFGFSRTGPTDQGATHVSTQVKGTAGYLDPEYLTTYQLNQKSDVYSFGILLLEIFTGRRPIELKRASDERVTVRWAFKKFVEGKVMEILDPRLEKTPSIQMVMERLAELAFACSAPTKNDRPSMKKVQEALWQIRKDYQGQTTAGSPSPPARSRGSIPTVEGDSRASSSMQSPHVSSPTRSSRPMSPAGVIAK